MTKRKKKTWYEWRLVLDGKLYGLTYSSETVANWNVDYFRTHEKYKSVKAIKVKVEEV